MNKLDLVIEFCESMANMHIKGSVHALAAARELRDMKPVAWYAQDNLEIRDEIEVVWSSEKPRYAEVWIPLYALGESND